MAAQRVQAARIALNFSAGSDRLLWEALDVTRHLSLALLGDKILDTLIVLAFREQNYSPHQIQNEITALAKNDHLKDRAVFIQLSTMLLFNGEPAKGIVPTGEITRRVYKRKHPPAVDAPCLVYDIKVLADAVEALIGAAFLAGGLRAAGKVVKALELDDRGPLDPSGWLFNWERIEHLYGPFLDDEDEEDDEDEDEDEDDGDEDEGYQNVDEGSAHENLADFDMEDEGYVSDLVNRFSDLEMENN